MPPSTPPSRRDATACSPPRLPPASDARPRESSCQNPPRAKEWFPRMSSGPTSGVPATLSKKAVATVALIGLEEGASAILRECFKQFGIQTVAVGEDAAQRLKREKFEACVLRL